MKESANYHDTNTKFSQLASHQDTDISESESEVTEMECDESENPDNNNSKKAKGLPIILGKNFNFTKLLEMGQQYTNHGVNIKYTRANTTIFTSSKLDFIRLRKHLSQETNARFHTYTLKSEKTHAFVIKGLDNKPSDEEVKEELSEKGVDVVKVYTMSIENENPNPINVVITTTKENIKTVRRKARINMLVVVKWERLTNRREIAQCHATIARLGGIQPQIVIPMHAAGSVQKTTNPKTAPLTLLWKKILQN